MGKGTEQASKLVKYSSEKIRSRLTPEEEAAKIDPRYEQALVYTRRATGSVVTVSRFLVDRLGKATVALGSYAAPRIKEHGEKYLPKSMTSEKGKSKMEGVTEVAASGIKGRKIAKVHACMTG